MAGWDSYEGYLCWHANAEHVEHVARYPRLRDVAVFVGDPEDVLDEPFGHGLPNMLGVKPGPLDGKVRRLLPDYMTMGESGMGNMSAMSESMGVPPNSIPMLGGTGPFGPIDMGGMFTIVKVRTGITTFEDPGWYRHPAGTVAERATPAALREDGITV